MFASISTALGIFLLIALITTLVRKVIIGFDDNYGRTIIPIVIVFLIGLVCNLVALIETLAIEMYNMSSEVNAHTMNTAIIALSIGYASLFFQYIIFKIIGKRIKNKKEKSKYESRWDLDKINKNGF